MLDVAFIHSSLCSGYPFTALIDNPFAKYRCTKNVNSNGGNTDKAMAAAISPQRIPYVWINKVEPIVVVMAFISLIMQTNKVCNYGKNS